MNNMNLTIIIPAYNAENFIINTLEKIITEFPGSEVIVINDGSKDKTLEKIQSFSNTEIINHEENMGKGMALRSGFNLATKDFIIFTDADLPYGVENIKKIYNILINGGDVAIGYRRKFHEGFIRHITHLSVNIIIQFLFWFNIYDTQCGLKGFKKSFIDKINSKLISKNFTIDIELLYLAKILKQRVSKVEVMAGNEKNTSTIKIKDVIIMLFEILKIRFNKNYFKK